jgi:hypothetical protein
MTSLQRKLGTDIWSQTKPCAAFYAGSESNLPHISAPEVLIP